MIRILQPMALVLALAAPASAQAPGVPAATPATATAGAAASGVDVAFGLEGCVNWGACLPVRLTLRGGASGRAGVLRLRTGGDVHLTAEHAYDVEAGGRRELTFTFCGGYNLAGLEVSLDGSDWLAAPSLVFADSQFVAVVGERIGRLRSLDDAMDSSGQRATVADHDETWSRVIPAEHVPALASGWDIAPVVLVDSSELLKMPREAVLALRDHALDGGIVIVAGASAESLPREVLAADALAVASHELGPDGAGGPVVGALELAPLPGAGRLSVFGAERPWAVSRRLGDGWLVRLGLDLSQPDVRTALDAAAWREILNVSQAGVVLWSPQGPPWGQRVESGLEQRARLASAVSGVVPPMVAAGYLVAAGIVAAVGTHVLSRRKGERAPGRLGMESALLFLAIAAPAFLAGAFRKPPATEPLTVVEHWEAERVSRFVSWTPLPSDDEIALPQADTHRPVVLGGIARTFPDALLKLGPSPSITVGYLPRMARLAVRSGGWREESGTPVNELLNAGAPSVRIDGGSTSTTPGTATPADEQLLQMIASPFAVPGENALIVLDKRSGTTAWVVHRGAP